MADKVIAADTESWLLIPAVEVLGDPYGIGVAGKNPIGALSHALVNEYLNLKSRASAGYTGAGGNITLSVKDDSKLAATSSETDNDKAINASGNSVVPTSQNYDAKMTLFRDKDSASTSSNYNVANDSVRARGIRYIAFRRIELGWDVAAAAGQKYSAFYVETDYPIDEYGDGNNQTINATFVTKSIAKIDAVLV
ncbi:phage tail tube protein [Pseudolysinimonas sp.]|uniref:phage tail tube protein n=1 Tax=Pseudolysinimonas sp. TaxID=2680009 RepID=UPI003F81FEF0